MSLLCDCCGERPALLRVTRAQSGTSAWCGICLPAAGRRLPGSEGVDLVRFFRSLARPKYESAATELPMMPADTDCPGCGLHYHEFASTGLLGCPLCYQAFASVIAHALRVISSDACPWEPTLDP